MDGPVLAFAHGIQLLWRGGRLQLRHTKNRVKTGGNGNGQARSKNESVAATTTDGKSVGCGRDSAKSQKFWGARGGMHHPKASM
eukprot:g9884.t1